MKILALGIFDGMTTQKQIRDKVVEEFQVTDPKEVNKFNFLIAYVDYGSYEGTGWMLMREKSTGELYENHSGHCSCYGNEGQFTPEKAPLQYLKSDKFSICSYGQEVQQIRAYIQKLKK